MHIGRAALVPPEVIQQHTQAVQDAVDHDPVVLGSRAVPTGEVASQLPHYNPVSDLIQRHALEMEIPPVPPLTGALAESYAGTPPVPTIVDLRA